MEDRERESVLQQRTAPKLAVLALDGTILSSEPGLREFLESFPGLSIRTVQKLPQPLHDAIRDLFEARVQTQNEAFTAVCVPVAELVVRATLLHGPDGSCIAVTFERLQVRSDVRKSAKRFGLSERETDIAELLVQGFSAEHIAQRLTISRNTVREHLKHIHAKLQVNTRAQLVSRLLNLSRKSL
jgi:DNA-binding CsgD family transcriptional regulator